MRPAVRAALLLLLASMPLLAVPTAYVIPVASARVKGLLYTSTLALRNDGQKDVQCEAIYAIPYDPKGGTLRSKCIVPADGQPLVDEDVLRRLGVVGTMRLACSGEVVVITRIQSSADDGATFDSGWTFPGMREGDAISRGKLKTLTALHDVVIAEVAGRPVTVEAIARNRGGIEVGRQTYEIHPFLQKLVELSNIRDDPGALTIELRVVSGDGAIVATDENRDPELTRMATRISGERYKALTAHQSAQTLAASSPPTGPTATQMLLISPFKGAPFQDPMTGLIYMRNRWYDPKTGTFISPDPEGNRDSANLYSFCGGDPVNCSDPTGLQVRSDSKDLPRAFKVPDVPVTPDPSAPRRQLIVRCGAAAVGDRAKGAAIGSLPGVADVSAGARLLQRAEHVITAAHRGGGGAGTRAAWNEYVDELRGLPFVRWYSEAEAVSDAVVADQPCTEAYNRVGLFVDASSDTAMALGVFDMIRGNPEAPPTNGSKPQWLRDLETGNNFNKARTFDYPYREVYVENPEGGYYRLDGYDPLRGEIVSRKFTQLGKVNESTAISYINEVAHKYPAGARIANVPSSGPLAGQYLRGQLILEVQVQTTAIPQSVLSAARARGVVIRDVFGNIY